MFREYSYLIVPFLFASAGTEFGEAMVRFLASQSLLEEVPRQLTRTLDAVRQ